MHQLGTAPHGIEREAARIAKHIEHTLATSIMLKQAAVFTLIYEEACLLPLQPIHTEFKTVLCSDIIVASTEQKAIHIVGCHKRKRCLTLIINIFDPPLHYLFKRTCYLLTTEMHTDGVSLHDSRLTIHINDKARQIVALAVYQSVGFFV